MFRPLLSTAVEPSTEGQDIAHIGRVRARSTVDLRGETPQVTRGDRPARSRP